MTKKENLRIDLRITIEYVQDKVPKSISLINLLHTMILKIICNFFCDFTGKLVAQ